MPAKEELWTSELLELEVSKEKEQTKEQTKERTKEQTKEQQWTVIIDREEDWAQECGGIEKRNPMNSSSSWFSQRWVKHIKSDN